MKKLNLKERLLRRNRKQTVLKSPQPDPTDIFTPQDRTIFMKPQPTITSKRKVWRVPGLRKTKRILAGILFIIDVVFFLGSLTSGMMMWATLFFLGVGFILLDYMYKTSRVKLEWEW